ncbi:ferredoxin--NADP reductase [Dokdonia sp. Hel_I_53]|uniref:ferredoxin--NADP reductase n=1 Tax=Dokdonia sp. Hel_I_53 TaxID=1566287 RepID=UPI00119B2DAD|nr:ferredoxin--NADP reductase [Dokdonia sp. Hel_I_53]TVZ52696.1 ring-1,2-phenylacetyl-CoA epoxidase subunit PaaE [Dokdonia sp. Hel_I_53]
MSQFHTLSIQSIKRITDKSVAISFGIPDDLKDAFTFAPGQYITLKINIEGSEVRRAYSLCSTPQEGLTVGVKEVENGTFSVYANRELKEGDTLEVHPPEGKFKIEDSAFAKAQHYAAFAAGSGITPILSMIKTTLAQSQDSTFVLVYGNRTPEEAMFREELLALRDQYKSRFSIEHIYSQSRVDGAHFGRIMKSTVNFVVKNKYASHNFNDYFLCGPEAMVKEVTKVLKENGVNDTNIHFELFTASSEEGSVEAALDGQTNIKVVCDDEDFEFVMKQTDLILDAALDKDIDAPHSCQGGVCSSCIARVIEGTAEMEKNQILTDAEVAEGLILTCQAHPTSAKVVVDYDDV